MDLCTPLTTPPRSITSILEEHRTILFNIQAPPHIFAAAMSAHPKSVNATLTQHRRDHWTKQLRKITIKLQTLDEQLDIINEWNKL